MWSDVFLKNFERPKGLSEAMSFSTSFMLISPPFGLGVGVKDGTYLYPSISYSFASMNLPKK